MNIELERDGEEGLWTVSLCLIRSDGYADEAEAMSLK